MDLITYKPLPPIPSQVSQARRAQNARPNNASLQKKRNKKNQANNTPKNPRDSSVYRAPVASTRVRRTGNPNYVRQSNGDLLVAHREFLADIPPTEAFAVTKIPVNPGLSAAFPWLSQMSSLYESYKFEKLQFEFQTTSSTTDTGSVMMAVDYDASDANPVEKQQLASYKGYARSSPWNSFKQDSVRENLNKRSSYFIRTGALSANQDIKLYDVGNLFIATQGQSASQTNSVGELYVDYIVRLMTPQQGNPALGTSKFGKYTAVSVGPFTSVSGSNAPLEPSGTLNTAATSVVTLKALGAYQGMFSLFALFSAGGAAPTLGGTATTGDLAGVATATQISYDFDASFLAGQTLTIAVPAGCTALNVRVGQYSVAL